MPGSFLLVALLLACCSVAPVIAGIVAARRRRYAGVAASLLCALLLVAVAALCVTLAIATQGYRAFTREEVAALVVTEPAGPQSFTASFRFPDGRRAAFTLNGDELYVDAHILKWRPIANILGLHTAYELDRVAGRFARLTEERARARTIFPLSRDKALDLFDLRRRFLFLAPLVDAEYGSATFIAADRPAHFEVRVSTTGLLIREVAPSPQ